MPQPAAVSKGAPVTLKDIEKMLIDGGYFRARITNLTPFDKIAGGLAWGILNSRFHIDVEFVENAIIRDKIRIAEDISAALKSDMNCPHDLDPHQIQGLDYPKIQLALEWLLKRVAAARIENEHYVEQFSILDFRRKFGHTALQRIDSKYASSSSKSAAAKSSTTTTTKGTTTSLLAPSHRKAEPAPGRVFKSGIAADSFATPSEHVSSVLLEYGVRYQIKDSVLLAASAEVLEGDAEMLSEKAKLEKEENIESAMLDSLFSKMTDVNKDKVRVSTSGLSSIMDASNAEKLAKLKANYEARHAEIEQRVAEEEQKANALGYQKTKLAELQAEQQQLQQKLQADQDILDQKLVAIQYREAAIEERREALTVDQQRLEEVEAQIRSDEARSGQLDQILGLLATKETQEKKLAQEVQEAKKKIAGLKDECRAIAEKIEIYKSAADDNEKYQKEMEKYDKMFASLSEDLAKLNQDAVAVMRSIDEYPTRQELREYEQRIGELDQEVAWKFETTRLLFSRYNTKTEVGKILKSEQDILSSIGSVFEQCIADGPKKAQPQRQQLLQQMDQIVKQLEESKKAQERKLASEVQVLGDARQQYEKIVDVQKRYNSLVEALKDRMQENAALEQAVREKFPEEEVTKEGEEEEDDDI